MATLNLLPWREQLREESKQQFLILLTAAVIFAGVILIFSHIVFAHLLNKQNERNDFLQQNISELDKKITDIKEYQEEKEKILTRMNIIYNLQDNRSNVVKLFNDLVNLTPPGVYFTEVDKKNNELDFTGRAESNSVVSQFMRNLAGSTLFNEPVLNKIEADSQALSNRNSFQLHVDERQLLSELPLNKDTENHGV